jgi:hypothetical protein
VVLLHLFVRNKGLRLLGEVKPLNVHTLVAQSLQVGGHPHQFPVRTCPAKPGAATHGRIKDGNVSHHTNLPINFVGLIVYSSGIEYAPPFSISVLYAELATNSNQLRTDPG